METKKGFRKLMGAFAYMTDKVKLECLSELIGQIKNDRALLRDALGIVERAYHPMANIEAWMETRFTKKPTLTPSIVIAECITIMKLNQGIRPLLWPLARSVQKRVKYRVKKKAEAARGKKNV